MQEGMEDISWFAKNKNMQPGCSLLFVIVILLMEALKLKFQTKLPNVGQQRRIFHALEKSSLWKE